MKFICLLVASSAVALTPLLAREGTTTATGTLTLEKKTYPLKYAVAYETTIDNEDAVVVVVSGQAVSSETLKEARAAEQAGGDGSFNRPFLKLMFSKTGELKYWSAAAGGTSLGRRSATAGTGDLTAQDSRVAGRANHPVETEGMFPSGFDVRFDTLLLQPNESLPASSAKKGGPAANVEPTVTGIFKGNGKDAKLNYVSARWGEPFSGKAGIVLVFTEKDHSKDKKADFNASFGRFGSAMIISLHEDGSIYGCQVVHSAHQKQGFSSIGNLEAADFSYEKGKVEGELTTHGQVDTFGETWEVNIKFVAPLGEIPKELQPAETVKQEKPKTAKSDDEEEDEPATQSTGSGFKAKDLALTKDASDVEYKALVGHIAFKSKSDVKSVCAELAANLKAQGWSNEGKDMVQPASSILKRKRESATLTIFVKPDREGSEVKIMTAGLSWEDK